MSLTFVSPCKKCARWVTFGDLLVLPVVVECFWDLSHDPLVGAFGYSINSGVSI